MLKFYTTIDSGIHMMNYDPIANSLKTMHGLITFFFFKL